MVKSCRTARRGSPRPEYADIIGVARETVNLGNIIQYGHDQDDWSHGHSNGDCGHEHTTNAEREGHLNSQPEQSGRSRWTTLLPWVSGQRTPTLKNLENRLGNYEPIAFSVGGMDCFSCGGILARGLSGTHGVRNARVNFVGGSAEREIATDLTTGNQIPRQVEQQTLYTLTSGVHKQVQYERLACAWLF